MLLIADKIQRRESWVCELTTMIWLLLKMALNIPTLPYIVNMCMKWNFQGCFSVFRKDWGALIMVDERFVKNTAKYTKSMYLNQEAVTSLIFIYVFLNIRENLFKKNWNSLDLVKR